MSDRVRGVEYPRPPLPLIDRGTLRMPKTEYVPEAVEKTGIVLHHTVGGSARGSFEWWLQQRNAKGQRERVGTAYIIERDGVIYEVFPPECWAHHLGIGDASFDARTIGIELASEGALVPADDQLLAFYNPKTKRGRTHEDPVVDLGRTWRGYRYFDAYDPAQIISLLALVDWLCDQHRIPRRCPGDAWEFRNEWRRFEGVFSHSHVRPDKSDIHPLGPWRELQTYARLQPVRNP